MKWKKQNKTKKPQGLFNSLTTFNFIPVVTSGCIWKAPYTLIRYFTSLIYHLVVGVNENEKNVFVHKVSTLKQGSLTVWKETEKMEQE